MIDKLLLEIEQLIGSDDFEYESERLMYAIESEGAGIEIVEQLLQIMERYPIYDFGMPGAMVHFIERFYPHYLPALVESVKRRPALHTIWMLNRCINASAVKDELIELLKDISNRGDIEEEIRNSAKEFIDFQEN